jgi:hypothetical protein
MDIEKIDSRRVQHHCYLIELPESANNGLLDVTKVGSHGNEFVCTKSSATLRSRRNANARAREEGGRRLDYT